MGVLPRLGDGWGSVEKLLQEGVSDLDEYDEFDSYREVQQFIHATGQYSGKRSFLPGKEDLDEQSLRGHQAAPRCPSCIQDIEDHKYNPDIDPRMESSYDVVEQEADFRRGGEKRFTGSVLLYCQRHAEESYFMFAESWYE